METNVSNSKGTELIKRNAIFGTPFTVITMEEGSFVGMGKYRLTDLMPEEECIQLIEDRDWMLICSLVSIISESIKSTTNE